MRKASRCCTRSIQCSSDPTTYSPWPPLIRCRLHHTAFPPALSAASSRTKRSSCLGRSQFLSRTVSSPSPRNNRRYEKSVSECSVGAAAGKVSNANDDGTRSVVTDTASPAAWASRFNALLPSRLGGSRPNLHATGPRSSFDLAELDSIIYGARKGAQVNILGWMVENGRRKAAVWLVEAALKSLVGKKGDVIEKHPSNINWPDHLFESIRRNDHSRTGWYHLSESASRDDHARPDWYNPFPSVRRDDHSRPSWSQHLTYSAKDAVDHDAAFDDDQHQSPVAGDHDTLLNSIWATLGHLVVGAANAPADRAQENMCAVLLILGQMHNLGMMPDGIYESKPSTHSAYVQRPPILNLVSSRILTALSDAAWRDQQDNAIEQATEMGMSLKEISESVPGGRFRLKVRPLGPEIWLELILWCCIEAGHIQAALRIIYALRNQIDNPWCAIRWCSGQRTDELNVMIDWERIKRRHGGTVGLIEGYSREKPFVAVPDRTISVEVVLALLDALINTCTTSNTPQRAFRDLRATRHEIQQVVSFLEPHDLPPEYFDYLESRLMQTGAFDEINRPSDLQEWSSSIDDMRRLKRASTSPSTSPDLRHASIVAKTLMHMGVQHQALDGLIQLGDVHRALAQFNTIQENVDQHKFKSITDFLQMQPVPEKDFFSTRLFRHRLEYSDSYGQLPYYKLAGFLNLVSDTKLTGLGQWLLYSDDLDGALIPESTYGLSCMLTALCRFAAANRDEDLLARVVAQASSSRRKPTVRFLRRLFDADAQNLDFRNARNQLLRLKNAEAGGVGLTNIAHLAGIILQLEQGKIGLPEANAQNLTQAASLMDEILQGYHSTTRGNWRMPQRIRFRQQVAHMLKVFNHFDGTTLQNLAQKHVGRYRSGNLLSLPANVFNILLSAAVLVHGSATGKELWDLFCQGSPVQENVLSSNISIAGFDAEGEVTEASLHTDATPRNNVDEQLLRRDRSGEGFPEELEDQELISIPEDHRAVSTPGLESDYADPFFQQQIEEVQPETTSPLHAHTHREPDDAIPFANDADQSVSASNPNNILLLPAPITVPNLQTLRIIVRAAVDEKRIAQEDKIPMRVRSGRIKSAQRILKWSMSEFNRIGNMTKNVIEQEIQQPVSSLDDIVEDRVARSEAPRSIVRFAEVEKGRQKSVPISRLWTQRSKRWSPYAFAETV